MEARPIAIFYFDELIESNDFNKYTERLEKKLNEYNVIRVRGKKEFVQCEIIK